MPSAPRVFISYSHDSEEHRERVLGLAERLRQDGLDAQLDQYVNGSPVEGWPRWMRAQLKAAEFVLVVCTDTYYRRFFGEEEPGKGNGADWEGTLITQEIYDERSKTLKFVPVMMSAGLDEFVPEPLRKWTRYELTSEATYGALYRFLRGVAGAEAGSLGELKPLERRIGKALIFDDTRAQRLAPSRLTHTAAKLFGRDGELARLEAAWSDPKTRVVTLVAWGGVGKTSLVATWAAGLAQRDYDGADYFDWSFYSQGVREEGNASGDAFIDAGLRFFGDEELADSPRSPWDKGARLAQLVAERRTLLVLDGLEPLQHPPGPLAGELKDPAVAAMLKGLAQRNPGLCVVTTRESVMDLSAFRESSAPEWELEHLSVVAGVALLESLKVRGSEHELRGLVEEVGGHALTIDLLGRYLAKAHGGDVRRRDRVDFTKADATVRGGHVFKTIAAYERWLASSGASGARQLAILRLLGLFDRPASEGCIDALRREPVIEGLTESLVVLDEEDWNAALSELEESRLAAHDSAALDTHPLIREHFARRLREESPEAWKAAHGRLFEHLEDSAEYRPDVAAGLAPLYQAVVHGCHAGRAQEACIEVYRDRILRGNEFFSVHKLGVFSADLGAVACFFSRHWSIVSPTLTKDVWAWLLSVAAFHLRALGRLTEAVEPMRSALHDAIEQGDWKNAAISASNLSDIELTLGDLGTALLDAELSVDLANRSGGEAERVLNRTAHAEALHQVGRQSDALARFREAEAMQAEMQPQHPLLYSLQGFQYCDLLCAEAERAAKFGPGPGDLDARLNEVNARATQTLVWATRQGVLLDSALDHLTLGRARLYRALFDRIALADAEVEIEQAVDGLRRAGQQDHLPRGLLTRAWLRAAMGDAEAARADLGEAQEIAERGPMPLHLADVALYRARLFHDRDALAEARRLIDKHGYERRRGELEDAEGMAASW